MTILAYPEALPPVTGVLAAGTAEPVTGELTEPVVFGAEDEDGAGAAPWSPDGAGVVPPDGVVVVPSPCDVIISEVGESGEEIVPPAGGMAPEPPPLHAASDAASARPREG